MKAPLRFLICFSLAASAVAGSVKWPFEVRGELADSEIAAIVREVKRQEKIRDYHILDIKVKSAVEVEGSSGRVVGPEEGSGYDWVARKEGKHWKIYGTGNSWSI
jgi:hypothetical protein